MGPAICVALIFSGCEVNTDVGVGFTSSGRGIELIVPICSDDSHVTGISISIDSSEGKGTNEIWAIRSIRPDGGRVTRFVVGETPPGFLEETRPIHPLPWDEYVSDSVGISNQPRGGSGAFKPSELEPGRIFVVNRNISHEEFEEAYECRR